MFCLNETQICNSQCSGVCIDTREINGQLVTTTFLTTGPWSTKRPGCNPGSAIFINWKYNGAIPGVVIKNACLIPFPHSSRCNCKFWSNLWVNWWFFSFFTGYSPNSSSFSPTLRTKMFNLKQVIWSLLSSVGWKVYFYFSSTISLLRKVTSHPEEKQKSKSLLIHEP